jgi:uncharacterized membrane protein
MVRSVAFRTTRILAMALAAAAVAVLLGIVFGIPAQLGTPLIRFREPTWVLWGALALFALAREHPATYLSAVVGRAGAILGSRAFYGRMTAVLLGMFVLVAIRTHLSFHTFSHDFSVFDESLYQSNRGRFLYSPVLGRSFLAEHVSPILALLVPLHRLFPTPYLLIIMNAVLLWAAVLPLRSILDSLGVSRVTRNIACLVYLANPITIAALDYGFHIEVLLPVTVLGMYAVHLRGLTWAYAALLLGALAIKEDVALYLIGLGAFLFVAERRRAQGVLTIAAAATYLVAVFLLLRPVLADGTQDYKFLYRWAAWGTSPLSILTGMISHPFALVAALAATSYVLFFYRLLFFPFFTGWGWLLFAIPWVLGATSGLSQQATLGLYYGIPLLSFAAIAAAHGLASSRGRRLLASGAAPWMAAAAIVLNVAHFTVHPVPPERPSFLVGVGRIPRSSTIQAMPALYPTVDYDRPKSVLLRGASLTADYVLLRSQSTVWPFSNEDVRQLAERAVRSGQYERAYHQGTFTILRRKARRAASSSSSRTGPRSSRWGTGPRRESARSRTWGGTPRASRAGRP